MGNMSFFLLQNLAVTCNIYMNVTVCTIMVLKCNNNLGIVLFKNKYIKICLCFMNYTKHVFLIYCGIL